jgi:hypothetical protein
MIKPFKIILGRQEKYRIFRLKKQYLKSIWMVYLKSRVKLSKLQLKEEIL